MIKKNSKIFLIISLFFLGVFHSYSMEDQKGLESASSGENLDQNDKDMQEEDNLEVMPNILDILLAMHEEIQELKEQMRAQDAKIEHREKIINHHLEAQVHYENNTRRQCNNIENKLKRLFDLVGKWVRTSEGQQAFQKKKEELIKIDIGATSEDLKRALEKKAKKKKYLPKHKSEKK